VIYFLRRYNLKCVLSALESLETNLFIRQKEVSFVRFATELGKLLSE